MNKRIAVLALQGAFIEHEKMLQRLGADVFEIREKADWQQPKDGLVIPGGESTVMAKLLVELGLHEEIRNDIVAGLPVFGTCAGLILLSEYVRQHSFATEADVEGVGKVPMTFIRAPYIESVGPKAEALASVDGHIVAARQDNQLVTAFHPELTDDTRVHEAFLRMI